jgi:FkbM family methyltransferase
VDRREKGAGMMSMVSGLVSRIFGNRPAQRLLEYNIRKSMNLMGVGSGDGVGTSGEVAIFRMMEKCLVPPYCIFDVGANQGQFLNLLVSNIKSAPYHVHCFEPGSHTFERLSNNAKKLENVTLNNIGLGKEKGSFELYYNEAGAGIASLTKRRLDHFNIDFSESETVNIDTLDNYCEENKIQKIDLLKIDVEGHELDVLSSGASRMFQEKAIRMASFEFGGCNIDTRSFFQDFFYLFKEMDMELFRITPSGYLYPIPSYREIYEQFRTTNFLAVDSEYVNTNRE